jgi:methylenetetrahydrofolate dehydrogenase (NADP+)/methenyltetrahydrofolate cyclohydrolase
MRMEVGWPLVSMTTQNNAEETGKGEGPLILNGRSVAKEMRRQCAEEVAELLSRHGLLPGLAVVRVGEDPSSLQYAERISKTFSEAGLTVSLVELPGNATRAMLQAELSRLNVLPEIAGVIVQMPLPSHMGMDAVIEVLDSNKDVDGIHPINIGQLSLGLDCFVPATPEGGVELLDYYGISVEGKRALIVGRSSIVGKPLAQLLLARNATVTIAHSRTTDLPELVAEAEIVAAAVGKPSFIKGDMLKPGAVVLDFGAAVVDGQMTGDVEYESALERVSAITPVPGGTGPMTNAVLLKNTIRAIRRYMK